MRYTIKTLAITLILIIIGTVRVCAADSYVTLYGFSFDINDSGEAVIHGYDNRFADVEIPDTLLEAYTAVIDDYAFFGNTEIQSVSFEKSTHLRAIGTDAFYGCRSLKAVSLPDSVKNLGFGAFQGCSGLKTAALGNGIQAVPDQAFYECGSLNSVEHGESVKSIGARAFASCAALTRIDIPASVANIADNAFDGCDKLVIRCPKNSYARSYAPEKGIKYVITDFEPYIRGDADGDGVVSIFDVTMIQCCLAGMLEGDTEQIDRCGDVDGGGLTIQDATAIQNYLAEYGNPYKIGETVTAN